MMEWDNIGFELAATFEDGREAIAYLQENSVDVVLTDIRMRDISGLEVAQYVHEYLPHVKVVIISGYREFDYAKQAVEYNVVHYLVKPTQFDEVENIFKQIKAELDKEKTLEQESTKLKQRYEELMPLLQEQFFVDLLMGALIDEEEIQRRMRLLDMSGTPQNTSCILIHFNVYNYDKFLNENWEYGKERLDNAIRNFFNVKEEGIIYYTLPNNEGDIKAIALSTSYEDLNQMNVSVSRQLEKINRLIKSLMNLELEVKTGESFSNMISLANYKTSNRFRHITTDNDDKLVLEPVEYKQLISKYKLFMSIIYEGDKKAVNSLVETFLSEMEDLPLTVIKHIIS